VWTPEKLVQPGDSWLWADLDAAGAVTQAADPTIPGAGWAGGANWAGAGLGPYTHTAGATTALSNAVLTVGIRYLVRFTVSGRTAGSVSFYAGATAGAARSTNATFTEELTCTTSTGLSFVPSNDFDGAVTVVYAIALSANLVTCKGTLGNLVQAVPANMPWSSDADAPTSVPVNGKRVVYFGGENDIIASNQPAASWKMWNQPGKACSYVGVVKDNSGSWYHGIFKTSNTYATTEMGMILAIHGDMQNIGVYFSKNVAPTGQQVILSAAGAFAAGAHRVVEVYKTASDTISVLVDGTTVINAVALTNLQDLNPTTTNVIGGASPVKEYWNGPMGQQFFIDRELSADEKTDLRAYLKTCYAI